MKNVILDKDYWNSRYTMNQIGWDIGEVSPPLKEYFDQLTNKNISILIPGAGNAHEAKYLWKNQFKNTSVVDISNVLVDKLKKENPTIPEANIICEDFFDHKAKYDLIIEQTFFCTFDSESREKYVAKMKELLNPGGKIAGLLFNVDFGEGPPFGGNVEEYKALFARNFEILKMEEARNSIQPRLGSELFFILELKPI